MPRAQKILKAGETRTGEILDTLLLKFDERSKQRGFVFGAKGTCVEFDFPAPPLLCTDDLLVLDDGSTVEVVADVEPVLEVRDKDFAKVARLVLALGNRHVPVQVLANRLRVRQEPQTERLLAEHGFTPATMTAPFEPDDGSAGGHDHGHHDHHGHGHHHDHEHHDHHDHSHHDHDHHDHDHQDHSRHEHGHRHGET